MKHIHTFESFLNEATGITNEGVTSVPTDSPHWVQKIFRDKEYVAIESSRKLEKGDELVGIHSGTFYEVFKDNGAKVAIKDDAYGSQKTYSRKELESNFLIKDK